MTFYDDICSTILTQDTVTKEKIHKLKIKLCKQYKLKTIPSNSDIIAHIPASISKNDKTRLVLLLQRKPMRTISGVAIIAVMTSPESCPHGTCLPCPGGPVENSPQSYTGYEPAAMRAKIHNFDPYHQVQARLHQLSCIGHPTDKIDLIIMGGTFTARSPWYQQWYIKRCYDALNNTTSSTMTQAINNNENAPHRCIGLTLETRPDWFRLQQIDQALQFGATRIELGVQTIFDDVLYTMKRGHTVSDTIDATKNAKNAGFKICYHLMPGLPGSDRKKDEYLFNQVFSHQDFKPDMIKIYPCLVIKGTPLYDLWKEKKFHPLSSTQAADLLSTVLEDIPEWIRIQRIQRDVPAQYIDSGVKKSNLRQLVDTAMDDKGINTSELRTREIGHKSIKRQQPIKLTDPKIKINMYPASGSEEVFISLVEPSYDAVVGYLRLRNINESHRPELTHDQLMMIRELKVLGKEVEIGNKQEQGLQHKGFGSILIKEAEKISKEVFHCHHLYVLSGIGVKPYYRKYHDFKDEGVYLYKKI